MQTQTNIKNLMDCDVTDSSGHKVGTVKQVYLNDVSGEPEWVRVHTGWFGSKESFVPLADARRTNDVLQIPYDKDKVKHAPSVDADQHLSREQVSDLYRYYGLRAPSGRAVPGQGGPTRPEERTQDTEQGMAAGAMGGRGQAARGQAQPQAQPQGQAAGEQMPKSGQGPRAKTDPAAKTETMASAHGRVAGERDTAMSGLGEEGMVELTLSEERVRVGTERHESERVRLRKRIEVEQIERTVPVYREELRVEREPIAEGEATTGGGQYRIGEDDEREFILHEERPMITKEIVPVERIRVHAERVASEQTVRDEIRKERMDIAHNAGAEDTTASGRSETAAEGRGGREMGPGTSGRHERK